MSRKKTAIPIEERTWLTAEEAATQLGIGVAALHTHVRNNRIPYTLMPLSNVRVFDKETIQRLRRGEPVQPPQSNNDLPPGAKITTMLELSSRG